MIEERRRGMSIANATTEAISTMHGGVIYVV
jgi:hypothetical protein